MGLESRIQWYTRTTEFWWNPKYSLLVFRLYPCGEISRNYKL